MSTAPAPAATSCSERLVGLRALVSAADARTGPVLPFGLAGMDELLADGGLGLCAVHDVAAAAPTLGDDAASALFVAGVAGRAAGERGTVLWVVTAFDLYAPGLAQGGLPADRVLFAEARDDAEALALAEDGLNHGALAAVVAEVRRAPMVATRRLQLASERGRTPALLLRRWRRQGVDPLTEPSAASTRWRIGCAPSARLPVPGVARARWTAELVRQRNGRPFSLLLEACDDQGRLALPPAAPDRAVATVGAAARAA